MKKFLLFLSIVISQLLSAQNLDFAQGLTESAGSSVYDIAKDASGNYYVIGSYIGSASAADFDPSSSVAVPPDPIGYADDDSYADAFIAKYNNAGEFQWVQGAFSRSNNNGGTNDQLRFNDVEIDGSGNIYVLGQVQGQGTFSGGGSVYGAVFASGSMERSFIKGYAPDGSDLQFSGGGDFLIETGGSTISSGATGEALFIDASGNLFITGRFQQQVFGLSGFFSQDMAYYARYNASGVLQDAKSIAELGSSATTDETSGHDIFVDGSGNIYISGRFSGVADFDPSNGTTSATGLGDGDAFFSKYNASGDLQWVKKLTNSTTEEIAYEIEPFGSSFLVRRTDAALTTAISLYDSDGSSSTTVGLSYDVFDMAVSSSNEVYLAGQNSAITLTKLDASLSEEYSVNFGSDRFSNFGYRVFVDGADIDFFGEKDFFVDFDPSSVSSGAPFGAEIWFARYSETVPDAIPPSIASQNPMHNAINVSVDTEFSIGFDEEVQFEGVSASVLIRLTNNTVVQTITINSSNLVNDVLTFSLNEDLAFSTTYYADLSSGVIEDISDNAFPGTNASNWSFTTMAAPDTEAPTIESSSPTVNATDVATDLGTYTLNMSEEVQAGDSPGTGGANYFLELRKVVGAGSTLVKNFDVSTADVEFNGSQILLKNIPTLEYSETYFIQYLALASNAITDLAGNPLASFVNENQRAFSTGEEPDTEIPTITSSSPVADATDVAIDLGTYTLNMSEEVQAGDSPGTGGANYFLELRKVVGAGSTLVKNFDVSTADVEFNGSQILLKNIPTLEYTETYFIQYLALASNAITDLAGNPLASFVNENQRAFSTGEEPDTEIPTITSSSPVADAIDVAIELGTYMLNMSEEVQAGDSPGTGGANYFLELRKVVGAGSTLVKNFDVSTADVEFNGSQILLKNIPTLEYTETYFIQYLALASNAITDLAGNPLASFVNENQRAFSTGEEPSITWNGSVWSNGTGPNTSNDVIIDGDYNVSTDGYFDSRDLTVNSGATLTVDGESSLVIQQDLVNNGSIVVESGSDFTNYSAYTITGNDITFKRNTRYADGRYSFVGSPVEQDASIVGSDLGSFIYKYNEATPYGSNDGLSRWEDASSDELVPGKGYTQAEQQEIVFVGMPNQGTITSDGTYTEDTSDDFEGWMLVANPYPAPIDIADFLSTNSNTSGSIYIWDDNGSNTERGSNADYIVANGTMATNTTAAGGQSRYNQTMGSMQAFFIKLNSAADVEIEFNESMRVTGNSDDNFFREVELPVLRINLQDDKGLFKQTVIGLAQDAITDELNRTYDAQAFSAASDFGLFTLKAGRSLALNGMPLQWESVQLQVNVAEAGYYSLDAELKDYEGTLFLRDNLTEDVINLSQDAYSFHSEAGIHTNRFELFSADLSVLGIEKAEVLIYAHDNVLHIRQEGQENRSYQVFNLRGQLVLAKEVQSVAEVNVSTLAKGVYLVFDGEHTHKVLLK